MKRALVASILGIAASVATTYGQSSFIFSTYVVSTGGGYGPVTWTTDAGFAPAGAAGTQVADSYGAVANVVWQYGATTGSAGLMIPLTTIPGYGAGWINYGNAVDIGSNFTTGTPITFTIQVWQGGPAFGDVANAATGSTTWVESAFTAGIVNTFDSYPGSLQLSLVPEPTTMSLAGLGAAAMLIMRRRK